jgi:putative ABC transport system ATP-binding protein
MDDICGISGRRRRVAKPIIRASDVWKEYTTDGQTGYALRGADLEIYPKEIVALFGKSGSGKTTLLNLLAGLDEPTRGVIEMEGLNLQDLGEKGRTNLRRNRIGFVFQFFNLLPTLTALENVVLALELQGRNVNGEGKDALEVVGLEGKAHRYPHELSGGEQQRVAIARALAKKPSIILADEPTGNLDTATGDQILALLSDTCRHQGTTLVMVTHTDLTTKYADRTLRMIDGRLVEDTSQHKV